METYSFYKTEHSKRKTACNPLIYKRFSYFNVVRLGHQPTDSPQRNTISNALCKPLFTITTKVFKTD